MRPIIPVIDVDTGEPKTDDTVSVVLKPCGGSTSPINCTRLGLTHRYRADSELDPKDVYHVYIDSVLRGLIPTGMSRYVWKNVTLSDVTTEQILSVGEDPLTIGGVDSQQWSMTWNWTNSTVLITFVPQRDRQAFLSTPPYIDGINLKFGVTLGQSGKRGTPVFDIVVEFINSD